MAVIRIDSVYDTAALEAEFNKYVDLLDKGQKKLEDYYAVIQKNKSSDLAGFVKVTDELATASDNVNQSTKKTKEAQETLIKTAKEVITSNIKVGESYANISGSIDDNIATQLKYKATMAALSKEQRLLKKEMDLVGDAGGALSAKILGLAKEETLLKQASTELTRTIRLQAKEALASAGSLDELHSQYDRLFQVFRGLSEAERTSDFGKNMQQDLDAISTKINETQMATGNFTKNVGRYAQSLAAPFESLQNKLDELKGSFAQGMGMNGQRDAQSMQQTSIAIAAIENAMAKASKETATSNQQVRALEQAFQTLSLTVADDDKEMKKFLGNLSKEVGGAKDAVDDLKQEIKLNASDTKGIDNATSVVSVLADTAQLAAGAFVLMGASEEDAAKITSKLIALQGIVNSVKSIGTVLTTQGTTANKAYVFVQNLVATSTNASATATARLNAILKLSTIGIVVAAVGALIWGISKLSDATFGMTKNQKLLNDINTQAVEAYAEEATKLKVLTAEYQTAATSIKRKKEIQEELTKQYPTYFGHLKTTKQFQEGLSEATDKTTKALFLQAKIQAATSILAEKFKKVLDVQFAPEKAVGFWSKVKASSQAAFGDISGGVETIGDAAVSGVNKAMKDYAELETFLMGQIGGMSKELETLGGDPKKQVEQKKAEAKEIKKVNDDTAADQLKSNFELNKNKLQQAAEYNKKVADDELAGYAERLDALNMFNANQIALVDLQKQYELDAEKLKMKGIIAGLQELKKEQGANIGEINKQIEKEWAASKLRVSLIESNSLSELLKIGNDFLQGRKQMLDAKYQQDVEYSEQFIQLEKDTQAIITKIRDKQREDETIANEKQAQKNQDAEKYKVDLTRQLYSELKDTLISFVTARYDNEKNKIQESIELIEVETGKKIDAVNREQITEEQKADKIAVINATAQVEKERLEQRKRKIDIERARFEKAANAAQIITSTASAIINALNTYKGTPVAFAIAATIGAIGALQLARVLATPIPKYRAGRGYGADELAWTGDGGVPEYIHRSTGVIEKTPAVATLTWVGARDKIYKNEDTMKRELAFGSIPLSPFRVNKDGGITKNEMEAFTSDIVHAVDNIQIQTTIITKEGWRQQNKRIRDFDNWVDKYIKN